MCFLQPNKQIININRENKNYMYKACWLKFDIKNYLFVFIAQRLYIARTMLSQDVLSVRLSSRYTLNISSNVFTDR